MNSIISGTRAYCLQNAFANRKRNASPAIVSCLDVVKPNGESRPDAAWHIDLPRAEMECWRPTVDDVDRISWGKPAKKKTTGSRGVPHRLNEEERKLYDFARQKGFLEVPGSGWRKERRGAPLLNTYRNWYDLHISSRSLKGS
jgi:hypothetical protein